MHYQLLGLLQERFTTGMEQVLSTITAAVTGSSVQISERSSVSDLRLSCINITGETSRCTNKQPASADWLYRPPAWVSSHCL